MYETAQRAATPKTLPETSEIISRINDKLTTLGNILGPVLNQERASVVEKADKHSGSFLVAELRCIEEKIANLVETVHL